MEAISSVDGSRHVRLGSEERINDLLNDLKWRRDRLLDFYRNGRHPLFGRCARLGFGLRLNGSLRPVYSVMCRAMLISSSQYCGALYDSWQLR
jgi:hypothetical protein